MTKRYPIKNEEMLAGRIARGYLDDSLAIVRDGGDPASFAKAIDIQPQYVWSFIHDSEHAEVGDGPDDGYTLSKSAEKRVSKLAQSFIQMDLRLLAYTELWMHWKGVAA